MRRIGNFCAALALALTANTAGAVAVTVVYGDHGGAL